MVVIAYRDMGCFHRRASAAYVQRWYARHGYKTLLSQGVDDATFTRAAAINAGVRRSSHPVIVQSDPDSLVPDPVRLAEAVQLAADGDGLVIPHDRYLYLSEPATAAVLTGHLDLTEVGPGDCDESGPDGSGNVVVFSRRTWETVGGFDERFGLWGATTPRSGTRVTHGSGSPAGSVATWCTYGTPGYLSPCRTIPATPSSSPSSPSTGTRRRWDRPLSST